MELSESGQTRRLFEASQTGNVQVLHQLLAENQLQLHSVSLASRESPLHVAAVAGHVDFVKESVRLKPAFAEELNQDGFSPMHIAAANGFLEIVRELLTVDSKLSQLKERDQWTPLHYAAVKGRVGIIREMVLACPDSVEHVTVQGETVFHLAVRSSQFEAVIVLVTLVREIGKLNVLQMKDHLGNTVLHLATWKKQHQVVDWLVHNGTGPACALEVNDVNQSGLTALDLLLIFPNEAGDREMEEILRGAGALRARDIVYPSQNQNQMALETHLDQPNDVALRAMDIVHSSSDQFVPFDSPGHHSQTASDSSRAGRQFAGVALNPPGGLWQDIDLSKNGTEPPHLAGTSNIASYYPAYSILFAVFNSIGFPVSLHMINILTTNFPLRLELQVCGIAMYFTYINGLITIYPGKTAGWYSLFALNPALPPLVLFAA
ncbi:hypothetical protein ACLB2K_070151 [Fragaria x ananassa]